MNNYWDVGQFFTVSMLANDIPKAVQAAEKLFKLKPPMYYILSYSLLSAGLYTPDVDKRVSLALFLVLSLLCTQ